MNKKLLFALATYTGTIIGAGIFCLPYVASQAGVWPMVIYFAVIGTLILSTSLMFGQVIAVTPGRHRLPGYANIYLGKKAKHFVFITATLGLIGTLLTYIILGGEFLHGIFGQLLGGPVILYALIYFAAGAYLIFRDARTISRIEIIMLAFLLLLIILFSFAGGSHVNFDNFQVETKNIYIPFGVIIFSLWGMSILPEIGEIMKGDQKKMKQVISWGLFTAVAVYILFIVLVWGISGDGTTEEAISGLKGLLGNKVILFGYIFGFLATFTSFITLGLVLKKIFWYDYGIPKNYSWFFATFIPLCLYLIGLRGIINVIGITGAFTLGIEGVIIFLICFKARKTVAGKAPYKFRLPTFVKVIFILIFVVGVLFQIINLLK